MSIPTKGRVARGGVPRPVLTASRRAATSVVAVLALMLWAGSVAAHAELVSSDPADGAVLATPPTAVTLTFSEGLNASESRFELDGPDGSQVGTGTAAKDGDEAMALGGLALGPGSYTIKWTSVSLDTDILRGTLTFTVSDGPSPAASSRTGTADAGTTSATSDGDIALPIVIALVLVAIVGAYVIRRSRAA